MKKLQSKLAAIPLRLLYCHRLSPTTYYCYCPQWNLVELETVGVLETHFRRPISSSNQKPSVFFGHRFCSPQSKSSTMPIIFLPPRSYAPHGSSICPQNDRTLLINMQSRKVWLTDSSNVLQRGQIFTTCNFLTCKLSNGGI